MSLVERLEKPPITPLTVAGIPYIIRYNANKYNISLLSQTQPQTDWIRLDLAPKTNPHLFFN